MRPHDADSVCKDVFCFFSVVLPCEGHVHFWWADDYVVFHSETAAVPASVHAYRRRGGYVTIWANSLHSVIRTANLCT